MGCASARAERPSAPAAPGAAGARPGAAEPVGTVPEPVEAAASSREPVASAPALEEDVEGAEPTAKTAEDLRGGDVVLGRYRLCGAEPIGTGGWCNVWAAEDTSSAEAGGGSCAKVAVKTYHRQAVKDAGAAALPQRFAQEVATFRALGLSRRAGGAEAGAEDARRLFVNLLDSSGGASAGAAPDGRFYTVLELADEPLMAWLGRRLERREALALGEVRRVARALAEGLSWMHGRGLCHLDVKPANLMRFGEAWKLIDLEGAVRLAGGAQLSTDYFTPLYSSPEVARAVLADPAVVAGSTKALSSLSPSAKMDTWAAGVVLMDVLAHECVLQETWSSFQMQAIMDMVEDDGSIGFKKDWYEFLADPAPLKPTDYVSSPAASAALLKGSAELQDLLARLLAKDPEQRLSAGDFLQHAFLDPGESAAPAAAGEPGLGGPSPCPRCRGSGGALADVTVGATHESWGRGYGTCRYACVLCERPIAPGLSVDACRSCECFWHRGGTAGCEKAAGQAPQVATPPEPVIDTASAPGGGCMCCG